MEFAKINLFDFQKKLFSDILGLFGDIVIPGQAYCCSQGGDTHYKKRIAPGKETHHKKQKTRWYYFKTNPSRGLQQRHPVADL